MLSWRIEIPGDPAPWQVYTRQGPPSMGILKCQAWQEQIRAAARSFWHGRAEIEGPVRLSFQFYLPWPENAPKIGGAAANRWEKQHLLMKPDLTNLEKAAEDALTRESIKRRGRVVRYEPVILVDDNQVIAKRECGKYFNNRPQGQTIIFIEEL